MRSLVDLAIGVITGLHIGVLIVLLAIPSLEILVLVGLKAHTPQQVAGYLAHPN